MWAQRREGEGSPSRGKAGKEVGGIWVDLK